MSGIARRKFFSVTIFDRDRAFHGYHHFAPFWQQCRSYVIDMEGRIVHYWELPGMVADWSELLPDGHLLAPIKKFIPEGPKFPGFCGANICEFDWEGNLVWEHEDQWQHHAVKKLPHGNYLILRLVEIPANIAKKVKGGVPGTEDRGKMWCDQVHEISPSGEVVWEWNAFEHLDIEEDVIGPLEDRSEWSHANAMEYDPHTGDILMTLRYLCKVIIIDRQTGNIKWKWGADHIFYAHSPSFLDNGNILIFNNGGHRPGEYRDYSTAMEVNPHTNEIVWEYKATPVTEFYVPLCGGAQRLPNGNTCITEATEGRMFEVTPDMDIVWEYQSPFHSHNERTGVETRDMGHSPWIHRSKRHPKDFSAFTAKDLDPERYKAINALYGPQAYKEVLS